MLKNFIHLVLSFIAFSLAYSIAFLTEIDLVKNAVKNFPNTVSVGLDLYKDSVAIKGWTEKVKEKKADYFFK